MAAGITTTTTTTTASAAAAAVPVASSAAKAPPPERKLTKEEILIAPECPKECKHFVQIVPKQTASTSAAAAAAAANAEDLMPAVLPAAEIARLLFKHGLHEPGPTQHEMWDHVALKVKDVDGAVKYNRRYRKTTSKPKPANAPVDKKLLQHRKRLATVLKTQIEASVDETLLKRLKKELEDVEALIESDNQRLLVKSKAAQAARLQKRQRRTIAGTTVAQLNHKNRNKFKAHDNTADEAYPLTIQNTVSKQNLPNSTLPIENTPWLFRANYMPHSFPAPSVASHAPRATITHSASGEVGCAGARSTLASFFVAQKYAGQVARFTGTQWQLAGIGEVNAAASSDFHVMLDLPLYNSYMEMLPTTISTHSPTVIDMQRLQEKVRAASLRKGTAVNTYPTGHKCTVGFGYSDREVRLYEDTMLRIEEYVVQQSIAKLPEGVAAVAPAATAATAAAAAAAPVPSVVRQTDVVVGSKRTIAAAASTSSAVCPPPPPKKQKKKA
jgi:hypothetical protein